VRQKQDDGLNKVGIAENRAGNEERTGKGHDCAT
jgi:hypothetical protein